MQEQKYINLKLAKICAILSTIGEINYLYMKLLYKLYTAQTQYIIFSIFYFQLL